MESPNAKLERQIARDFFEYAVIFSVDRGDSESFQRYLSSLRPFYTMRYPDLPDSELICTILGLNLLHLLVENKLASFHSEVAQYIKMIHFYLSFKVLKLTFYK